MTNFIVSRLQALYHGFVERYFLVYWLHMEPYWKLLKSAVLRSTAAFIITSFCLYVSAFLFGTLYYYSMPTTYQSYPLNFQYKRSCIQEHRNYIQSGHGQRGHGQAKYIYSESCFPSAIINFDDSPKKVIDPHQTYAVHLTLQLPESPTNLDIGFYEASTIHYKKNLNFSVMAISLFNVMENSQTIYICLFEKINFNFGAQEECTKKSDERHTEDLQIERKEGFTKNCIERKAHLQIDYPDIEISSATVHVTAAFSGLQYLLFQWPIISFLLGTMIFFTPVLASVLVLLYLAIYLKSRGQSEFTDSAEPEENNSGDPDIVDSMDGDEGQTEQGCHEDFENEHHNAEPSVSSGEVDDIGSAEYEKGLEDNLQDDDAAPED